MKKRILALVLSCVLLTGSAGAILSVEDARWLVEKLYIDPVPAEVLERDTVEGLFAGLDRYSAYLPPKNYDAFLDTMNDVSMVGLGIVSSLSAEGDCLVIARVMAGGAAAEAGVVPGDKLTAVDGRPVSQAANAEEAVAWMKGEEGTQVSITLLRADGREQTLTLTRAPFVIPYTEYELVEGHIGYISCDSFGEETYGHFFEALADIGDQVDCWVLDLRGNTGGITAAAAETAGIFTGAGNKALLRDRSGAYYGFDAKGDATTLYPVITLVDGRTASAAELLTAALRDGAAGVIIGPRTFGKGVAQTVVDKAQEPEIFADGDAVRITSARFYSGEGICNDKLGVLPHLLVDEQYTAAIARLLTYPSPDADNTGKLRLHLGSWRWYVDPDQALQPSYRAAFVELLEAMWPNADLYLGLGDNAWSKLSVSQVAQRFGLTEYTPRTLSDAGQSPYSYALNVLSTYDILRGDGTGRCNPDQLLKRGELCALLSQLLNTAPQVTESRFTDVAPTDWYAPAIHAMADLGFVEGDAAGTFRPLDPLTNEELVTILGRLGRWLSVELYETAKSAPAEEIAGPDLAAYSDWAKPEAWLLGRSQRNFLGAYISYLWDDIGQIDPQEPVTRDRAAYSLYRLLDLTGTLTE